jgi:hypothetical protein
MVQPPLMPDLADGSIHRLGKVAHGGTFCVLRACRAALGGLSQPADRAVQVLGFIQYAFRFQQDGTGGVGAARYNRAGANLKRFGVVGGHFLLLNSAFTRWMAMEISSASPGWP